MKWLVTLDDSAWASYAFNYTTKQARKDDMLYLLHITDAASPLSGHLDTVEREKNLARDTPKHGMRVLVYYAKKCQQMGFDFVMMKGSARNAGDLVCKAIRDYDIDVAVVGEKTKGGIASFLGGSTANRVLAKARCNVVILKQPYGESEEEATRRAKLLSEDIETTYRREKEEREQESSPERHRRLREEQAKKMRKEEKIRRREEEERERIRIERGKELEELEKRSHEVRRKSPHREYRTERVRDVEVCLPERPKHRTREEKLREKERHRREKEELHRRMKEIEELERKEKERHRRNKGEFEVMREREERDVLAWERRMEKETKKEREKRLREEEEFRRREAELEDLRKERERLRRQQKERDRLRERELERERERIRAEERERICRREKYKGESPVRERTREYESPYEERRILKSPYEKERRGEISTYEERVVRSPYEERTVVRSPYEERRGEISTYEERGVVRSPYEERRGEKSPTGRSILTEVNPIEERRQGGERDVRDEPGITVYSYHGEGEEEEERGTELGSPSTRKGEQEKRHKTHAHDLPRHEGHEHHRHHKREESSMATGGFLGTRATGTGKEFGEPRREGERGWGSEGGVIGSQRETERTGTTFDTTPTEDYPYRDTAGTSGLGGLIGAAPFTGRKLGVAEPRAGEGQVLGKYT